MSAPDSPAPRDTVHPEGAHSRPAADFRAPRALSRTAGAEARAVQVARTQRGNISREQLLAAGLSRDQITHRVRTGWLVRRHEGVYSIGTVGAIGLIQAALMACGPAAAATAHSAAALHDLLPYPAVVHVAIPRNGPRPPGVETYRPRTPLDWTRRHGLRTTTVPETLLVLAIIDPPAAQRATDQAFIHRRTDASALTRFLSDRKGRCGVRTLRELADGPRTRSHAEQVF